MSIELIHGDCLEVMPDLTDKVDLVLADPPYGTTQCKWDDVIPFNKMWPNLWRLTDVVCLFGTEPFSSFLRTSSISRYKYDWVWKKSQAVGHLNAWKMPLRNTENISVFYKRCSYKPQLVDKPLKDQRPQTARTRKTDCYGDHKLDVHRCPPDKSMPRTIIEFNNQQRNVHPTQKPTDLLEYLIKTYTNGGDTVLDFCMGSGSTGVACQNTGRNFIGIEKEKKYYDIACERMAFKK